MPIRILIADDNPQVRTAMREVLEASGDWEIVEAENGEQAIARARECLPRLIILDLVMPGMDGLAASREIATLLPGTPILMHTLHSSPQIQIEAAKTGIRKVVPKSEAATLVSAVREALEPGAHHVLNDFARPNVAHSESDRRRAEDRIRELCVQVITTDDDAVLESKLTELRDALHQHVEQFRARLIEYPSISERRLRNGVSQIEAGSEPKKREIPGTEGKVLPISDTAEEEPPSNRPSKARNGTQ
jgi:DNA-binding NarL/FixJ family response regulator